VKLTAKRESAATEFESSCRASLREVAKIGTLQALMTNGVKLMINLNQTATTSKSCGKNCRKGSNLLLGLLLAVVGISQTSAATPNYPGEDASPVWRRSACVLSGDGLERAVNDAAPDMYALDVKDISSLFVVASHQWADLTTFGYSTVSTLSYDATDELIARYDPRMPWLHFGTEDSQYADPPATFAELGAYVAQDASDITQNTYQTGVDATFEGTQGNACTHKLNEYSPSTVDWRIPLDLHVGGVHTNESHRLKYGYVSTTNNDWTIGARVSF
jgi:hypothetical protein